VAVGACGRRTVYRVPVVVRPVERVVSVDLSGDDLAPEAVIFVLAHSARSAAHWAARELLDGPGEVLAWGADGRVSRRRVSWESYIGARVWAEVSHPASGRLFS
jgi:hypothetical protein